MKDLEVQKIPSRINHPPTHKKKPIKYFLHLGLSYSYCIKPKTKKKIFKGDRREIAPYLQRNQGKNYSILLIIKHTSRKKG